MTTDPMMPDSGAEDGEGGGNVPHDSPPILMIPSKRHADSPKVVAVAAVGAWSWFKHLVTCGECGAVFRMRLGSFGIFRKCPDCGTWNYLYTEWH